MKELDIAKPRGESVLCWPGKEYLEKINYCPIRKKEIYGNLETNWRNKLFQGDNKLILAHLLREYREKIDLIYIDPPFGSNADYKKSIKFKDSRLKRDYVLIEEKQYNDIWKNEEYLQFMYERLQIMKELLSEEGNIFLHLDWRMDSYLRLILDEIFGRDNFVNRITWKATNSPKAQAKGLGKQQNSIFWYAKNKECMTWNQVYKPPTKEYKSRFNYNDQDGRGPYQTVPLVARGVQDTPDRKSFEFQGVVDKWLYSKQKLQEWWEDNKIYETRNGNYRKKVYLKDCQGSPASDIWVDKGVAPIQSEGYPTQKPESLLKRIIKLASNEGDLVADFFCGSGTTLVMAEKLNRRWIGADINKIAVQTARDRVLSFKGEVNLEVNVVCENTVDESVDQPATAELLEVEIATEVKGTELVLRLEDFYSAAVMDKIGVQEEVKIEDFTQMIASIYIDFDYKGRFNPTYIQTEEIQKEIFHNYRQSGEYEVVIQVTDILGNEIKEKIKI